MTEVTRGFCWHQNFVPWGCLSLTCSSIHLLNHETMCIKSGWRDSFLICNSFLQMSIVMRPSCWHKNFGPNGLSAPTLGAWAMFKLLFLNNCRFYILSTQVSDTGPVVLCSQLLWIQSSSNLQVTRTGIKSLTSLNYSQIWSIILELHALKWWRKWCSFSVISSSDLLATRTG